VAFILPKYQYRAVCTRVVYGDTYDLDVDLGLGVTLNIRARLRNVDAPEVYGVKKGSREFALGQEAVSAAAEWFGTRQGRCIVRTHKAADGGAWLVEVICRQTGLQLGDTLTMGGHNKAMAPG
jgi:hypothetical protein